MINIIVYDCDISADSDICDMNVIFLVLLFHCTLQVYMYLIVVHCGAIKCIMSDNYAIK